MEKTKKRNRIIGIASLCLMCVMLVGAMLVIGNNANHEVAQVLEAVPRVVYLTGGEGETGGTGETAGTVEPAYNYIDETKDAFTGFFGWAVDNPILAVIIGLVFVGGMVYVINFIKRKAR